MAIGLEEKKAIVAEVNETAASALSLVIADARGIASNDMTALRASARENQITLRVVRNTLAKRALEGTEYECQHVPRLNCCKEQCCTYHKCDQEQHLIRFLPLCANCCLPF